MGLFFRKITMISMSVLMAACSTSQESRREVNDANVYMSAANQEVKELKAPPGMSLPTPSGQYEIPTVTSTGAVGNKVDIRPPELLIPLINGLRVQSEGNSGVILLSDDFPSEGLGLQLKQILLSNHYVITSEKSNIFITDWIDWQRLDEEISYSARYEISYKSAPEQSAIMVRLGDIRHGTEKVTDPAQINRYTVVMMNSIIQGLAKKPSVIAPTKNVNFTDLTTSTDVDDSASPIVVVDAPFQIVWNRAMVGFPKVGMTIENIDREHGNISVKYKLSDSERAALGLSATNISNNSYVIQFGDLGNKTSLQLRSSKGKPVTESINNDFQSFVKVMLKP